MCRSLSASRTRIALVCANMASGRGGSAVRFQFGEGERVLCYEPDPSKAKVLYDSKVLECRTAYKETKSGAKRPVPEYLIHFSGWNSTWDRWVTEEQILADSPENRQLQVRKWASHLRDVCAISEMTINAFHSVSWRRKRRSTLNGTSDSS